MKGKRLVISAVLLVLVQLGFLSSILISRAAVLRNGTEVQLKVVPIDPRDLFRGDYVILGYDISRLDASIIQPSPADTGDDTTIFVRLGRDADGFWTARRAWFGAPVGAPGMGEVDMRGKAYARPEPGAPPLAVTYGIERYYVPEGEGRAIETDLRDRPFSVRVAVAGDGTAQIKALMDGDRMLFEEPLY